jgi:hypothetical protein
MPNLNLIPAGLVETLNILAISTAVFDLNTGCGDKKVSILSKRLLFFVNEMIDLGLL